MLSLSGCSFIRRDFGSELNTTANNAVCCGRDRWRSWRMRTLKIAPRVSLADVRCEWASILCRLVVENIVAKIIVAKRIRSEGRIVLLWSKIDRCAYTSSSIMNPGKAQGHQCRNNIPLFHRPRSRAPSSSLPCSTGRPEIALAFINSLNSGSS